MSTNMNEAGEIATILLSHDASSPIIRELYRIRKGGSRRFSLTYICRLAGIPSKGYLCDVMKGRRLLNLRFVGGMAKALGISGPARALFQAIVACEHERDPAKRQALKKKKDSARKRIKVHRPRLGGEIANPMLMLQLFCQFGLEKNRASLARVYEWFPSLPREKIRQAVEDLVVQGALVQENGYYLVAQDQIMFSSGDETRRHIQFLQEMILRSAEQCDRWFDRPQDALLESCFISVDETAYRKALPRIREIFSEIQSDLESSRADQLIAFNLQMFPVAAPFALERE